MNASPNESARALARRVAPYLENLPSPPKFSTTGAALAGLGTLLEHDDELASDSEEAEGWFELYRLSSEDPMKALAVVEELVKICGSANSLEHLAAGPFTTLMRNADAALEERVKTQSRESAGLRGVYQAWRRSRGLLPY